MPKPDVFETIILTGRPAAGKSEIIDYLKKTPLEERKKHFHIGEFEEFDDFPYVWQMFQDDDILSKHGKPRVWTTKDYYFLEPFAWNMLIEKINLAVLKRKQENPKLMEEITAIVEFARGGERGIEEAFSFLSDTILKSAGVVYIDVSYEESVRKNRKRARKGQEHSILHHSLPDAKMEFYYKINDWKKLSKEHETHIGVREHRVPYSVFPNEPEVTDKPDLLAKTLEQTVTKLWNLRQEGGGRHVENDRR